jgi:hypothetical protein
MIIYRFRVTSHDHEDFLREIELQPGQNFMTFHQIILSSCDLDTCDNAYFFPTDNVFKKRNEISFKLQKKQVRKYDDDLDQVVTETFIPNLMKDSLLKNFIEDPHQRLIYEYYGKDIFIFFIELFKIIKTDECINLPRCVTSKGELPKKTVIPVAPVAPKPPVPAAPKPVAPKKQVIEEKTMFSEMKEDEPEPDEELSEIESRLDEILEEKTYDIPKKKVSPVSLDEDDPFVEEEEADEDAMESLDEYEDIEDIEVRNRNFDSESEDE